MHGAAGNGDTNHDWHADQSAANGCAGQPDALKTIVPSLPELRPLVVRKLRCYRVALEIVGRLRLANDDWAPPTASRVRIPATAFIFLSLAVSMFFDQTFAFQDLAIVALLIVLEGVLSIDNALVLGLLAKRLPKREQARALTYGLIGAFVFRFISIATAQLLLRFRIVKLIGGAYLGYVALKYFWESWRERAKRQGEAAAEAHNLPVDLDARKAGFWSTVFVIELTDIAFAVDSILAAIALVGAAPEGHTGWHPKLWVVVTGGMLGVILMRYAATVFIKLLERFPRFETAAYLLVLVIGGKLILDWQFNTAHEHRLDFHSPSSPAFWIFWITMLLSFSIGFIPKKQPSRALAHGVPTDLHGVPVEEESESTDSETK